MLSVKLVGGFLPKRSSEFAAGYDLYSNVDIVLTTGPSINIIPIGICVAIPYGHYGRISPRSSLAIKGIDVGAGVIDQDYRGELRVVIYNLLPNEFKISRGDRVAQLILEKNSTPDVIVCDELPTTHRGNGGFGSTGK